MAPTLSTPRLLLRGWQPGDAPAALEIYGKSDVAMVTSFGGPILQSMSVVADEILG